MHPMYRLSSLTFVAGALLGAAAAWGVLEGNAGTDVAVPGAAGVSERRQVASAAVVSPVEGSPEDVRETSVPPVRSGAVRNEAAELAARLAAADASRARLSGMVERLTRRIDDIEKRLAAATADEAAEPDQPPPERTPEGRRQALETAGVSRDWAMDLIWREGQYELARLELRDQALREGWFGSDRYRQQIEQLAGEEPDLRAELGDELYDRFLYSAGENNRLRVQGVIAGSIADDAGLRPGDLIESYGAERVFSFSQLRGATSDGVRGELVPVSVVRSGGERTEIWVPRGPLGVRLDQTRVAPET